MLADIVDGRGDASERVGRRVTVLGEGNDVERDRLKGVRVIVIASLRPRDGMRGRWETLETLTSRPVVCVSLCDERLARVRRETRHVLVPGVSACEGRSVRR